MSLDFDNALCKIEQVPTEVFFGSENETPLERDLRVLFAKAVCERCSIRVDCLTEAIHNDEQGIWGGTVEKERIRSHDMPNERAYDPEEVLWIKVASSHGVTLMKTKNKLNQRWQVCVDGYPRVEHSLESEGWIAWNRIIEGRMRAD